MEAKHSSWSKGMSERSHDQEIFLGLRLHLDPGRDCDPTGLPTVSRLPGSRTALHPSLPHHHRSPHFPDLGLWMLRLSQWAPLSHLNLLLDPRNSLSPPAPNRSHYLQHAEPGWSTVLSRCDTISSDRLPCQQSWGEGCSLANASDLNLHSNY